MSIYFFLFNSKCNVLFITGVVANRPFSKGDIVCNYHGRLISGDEGHSMMDSLSDEAGYHLLFKAGQRDSQVAYSQELQ